MSTNCRSCGKMMSKNEDFSGGNINSQYYTSCTNADGSLKSLDEITLSIANQLIMSQGIDREAATKAARSILSVQPEWRKAISDRDQRPARRQKALLISVSVVLSVALVLSLVYNGIKSQKSNKYHWEDESITDKVLFTDIKPTVTKEDHDGATVARISFPGNQYNPQLNKWGDEIYFYDRVHGNSAYKISIQERKVSGINLGKVGNDFRFIGSAESKDGNQLYYYLTSSNVNGFDVFAGQDLSNIMGQDSEDSKKINGQMFAHVNSPDDIAQCGKYLVWIQNSGSDPTQQQVYAFNPETWKKYVIDESTSSKEKIRAGENTVYWLDDYDSEKFGQFVKGYDFKNKKIIETKVSGYTGDIIMESGSIKIFEKIDDWGVSGDDVISNDSTTQTFTIFNNNSGTTNIIKDNYGNQSSETNVIIKNIDGLPSNDQEYHLTDPKNFVTSGNYLAWLSDNNGKKCVSWSQRPFLDSNKPNFVEVSGYSDVSTDLLSISDDWLIWLASTAKDEKQWVDQTENGMNQLPAKYDLYATNLKTGEQVILGTYSFDGVEDISVSTSQNGLVAWTAWTNDAGYDIFYTKLP
jgi:hypothetical protein